MLVISVPAVTGVDPAADCLGRRTIGYAPTMTPGQLYDASRGVWAIDDRTRTDDYYLIAHAGTVYGAGRLYDVAPCCPRRCGNQIAGLPLLAGHRVYDIFVGNPSPIATTTPGVTHLDLLSAPPQQAGTKQTASRHTPTSPGPTTPAAPLTHTGA